MNVNEMIFGMSPDARRQFVAESVSSGLCTTCDVGGLPDEYSEGGYWKDALSAKEYLISGMCQCCQDAYFTVQNLED